MEHATVIALFTVLWLHLLISTVSSQENGKTLESRQNIFKPSTTKSYSSKGSNRLDKEETSKFLSSNLDELEATGNHRTQRSIDNACDECPQYCELSDYEQEVTCTCFRGFRSVSGPLYCKDIDECSQQHGLCQPRGRCINTAGSFVCRCASGYRATPDGQCVDIDECASAKSPCSQICTNLPGNYSCSCYKGYALLPGPGPGICRDLNECELHTDGCSHLCSNTEGSFVCRCPAPLLLSEDRKTCVTSRQRHRKSPAAPSQMLSSSIYKSESRGTRDDRNFCQFKCLNGGTCKQGHCHCPTGLTGTVCENDIDECSVLPSELQCAHQCTNTFGSFQCECRSGWILGADRRSCLPETCVPGCMGGGTCVRGVCQCPPGLTGPACGIDEDECLSNPCEQLCRNTLGSYVCLCRGRWRLAPDGHSCLEPPCMPHCRNGGVCRSGRCICKPGFHGRLCQLDINECASQDSPCKHACVNSFGSYQCLCPPGMRLSANRTTCEQNPQSDDQPRNQDQQVDVVIEIVVEDQYSRMTYHTMEPKAVHLPWFPTSYPPKIHPDIQYHIITQTVHPVANIKTDNNIYEPTNIPISVHPVSSSSLISSMHNILHFNSKSEHYPNLISNYIMPSQTHESHDDHSHILQNVMFDSSSNIFDPIYQTVSASIENKVPVYFPIEVKELMLENLNASRTVETLNSPSVSNLENYIESQENTAVQMITPQPDNSDQNNVTIDEEDNRTENIIPEFKVDETEGNTELDIDEVDYPIVVDSILSTLDSNESIDYIDPTPSSSIINSILPTVHENIDLIIREIENSLFPFYTSTEDNKKTDNSAQTVSVSLTSIIPLSSSVFESETILVSISPSDTPSLPVSSINLEVVSTTFHSMESNILQSQTILFSTTNDGNDVKEQNLKKKHKLKKKKKRQRKGGKFGKDLLALNQILQSFDLQAASPDDIKKYELIDLDELVTSSVNYVVASSVVPSVPSASLPVLQGSSTVQKENDCYYGKKKYKSRSSFYRDEKNCTKCVCKNGELRCTPRHCPPPHCEGPISGDCCDYCPGDCVFEQQVYLPGERFSPYLDPCRECRCESGRTVCHDVTCPALACPAEYRVQLPDECCPVCVPPEPGCFWNGRFFYTGQLWIHRQGGCQACLCKDKAEVQCNPVVCVVGCQHPQFVPGDCCPLCEGCQHHGQQYEHEQTFTHPTDPCSFCQCQHGNITCFEKPCKHNCSHPFKPPGECCPKCSDCLFNGEHIKQGASHSFTNDNNTCMDCTCQAGEVSCQATECLPGCEIEGGRHVSSGAHFSIGRDPCTKCRCLEGHVECRAEPCPVQCSHGVLLPRACCLDCSHCEYKGRLYRDLEVFRPPEDPCQSCLCARGNVLCDNSCEGTGSESEEDEDNETDDDELDE